MPRYSVPLTILAAIEVDAASPAEARTEAHRFAESMGPADGFVSGWNSAQPEGAPRIVTEPSLDVEGIELTEVEEIPGNDCTGCGEELPLGPAGSTLCRHCGTWND